MRYHVLSLFALSLLVTACREEPRALASRDRTFAELRTVRRGVTVASPGEAAREPFARERLVDGSAITVAEGGLAWLRRDGGATLLVSGPARLELRHDHVTMLEGRAFIDALGPVGTDLAVPHGKGEETLHLSDVRASVEVAKDGAARAYVLRGGVRTDAGAAAGPGEALTLTPDGKAKSTPELVWEDWTGGLATTDPTSQPAPYGVGTVGARDPGARGAPRFPLSIQKLEVRVTVDGDLATTEVEEIFFNPSSATVEGLYRFRTPMGATLHAFGVDRDGELVWGRAKEQAAAAAQYQQNVYAGSKEDPALLEWDAPGVFKARLYPIVGGGTRRVVTRYAEWLGRQGAKGERRLYTYPMAAEGAEGTLPRIEELTIKVDLRKAHATDVRAGMDGVREGSIVTVRQWDTTPRADFALELFDEGINTATAYRAPHNVSMESIAPDQRARAKEEAKKEVDYVLVPVRASQAPVPSGGLDLAIVVDASAATEPSALALARQTTGALLAHLGKDDRVAVWAGDTGLRAVVAGSDAMSPVDAVRRIAIVGGLAKLERGGATDIGALVSDAAQKLDPNRRSAVVYIGDGRATVGELALLDLRARLDRLPRPLRLFSVGVGHEANMGVLQGLSRGALSTRVTDASGAAAAALRLLEEAERPVWLGVTVDLGPGIERVYPRDLGALAQGDTALVVGRVSGELPKQIVVKGSGGEVSLPLAARKLDDDGDLERRWAEGRLVQLLDEGAGRAAVVEIGTRYGVVTPFTSLYVPTKKELQEERQKFADAEEETDARKPESDNKEGGTGTRAKGEEGSMGNPSTRANNQRYAVKGPADNPSEAQQKALREAAEFGMIGLLNPGAGDPNGPAAPWGRDDATPKAAPASPPRDQEVEAKPVEKAAVADGKSSNEPSGKGAWGGEIGDAFGAGGLGLSGIGEGGGGRGEGIGLGSIGSIGHGAGTGTGQGFGSGHGRLGGDHKSKPPEVRMGATTVNGRLPPEVIQRIVRQNFGRFRLCYEQGLKSNPNLQGRVSVRFKIHTDGTVKDVGNGGSDLPEAAVVSCVMRAFDGLSFPQPEGGTVSVVFPINFAPGDGAPSTPAIQVPNAPAVVVRFGDVGHIVRRCGFASSLPLEERVTLWRERLQTAIGNVAAVKQIYVGALDACEAGTWRERTRLLGLLLDALPAVKGQVELWRALGADSIAADVLYRSLLARVRTPAQIREMNDALGLKRMDPALLAKSLADKSVEERVKILRDLAQKWPDDHELSLKLLDAYEDAGDSASGRAFARKLRALPGASTRVRTGVGEYYLRLGKKPGGEADTAEARRTFGEIVEFAPDDPVARRRLGDLLRSHGWHADAFRQYETLALLTPDDATVPLLLGTAAEGMGRVEEAIKWTEKASAGSAPDGQSGTGRTARGFASVFLAWAREAAKTGGRTEEVVRLRERAKRLAGGDAPRSGARVIVTWSHPEVHPALWSNALGGMMPARDGDPLLGIAEVALATGRDLEVRLEPDDRAYAARLGAEVIVTALFDEGTESERIVRIPLTFTKDAATRKFRVEAGALKEIQ